MKTTSMKWINTLLFDLDGVIIDSNQTIVEAWINTAEEYGCTLSPLQINKYIVGASHQYTLENLFPHHSKEMRQSIQQKVLRRESEAQCELIRGLKSFLRELQQLPLKLGIVSGSWPEKIHNVLTQHDLQGIDCIISAREVASSKPEPLPYLTALARMNSKPELTLAFEDSDNGIVSALSAGAHCIAINHPHCHDVVSVKDFTRLSLDKHDFSYGVLGTNIGLKITPD